MLAAHIPGWSEFFAISGALLLCTAADAEPPAERLGRHALGRADAAERLGLCLQDHARTLKDLAEQLLAAEGAAQRESLRAELRAAHRALDACLPPAPDGQPRCNPLPPARLAPPRRPAAPAGALRLKVVAVDPGMAAASHGDARTRSLRDELNRRLEVARPRLLGCYRPALARDPALAGAAVFKLSFAAGGRVETAKLLSTSLANVSVAGCTGQRIEALRFAADSVPAGATAVIQLGFAPAD
jgi:hypothetical protein